MKEPVVLLEDCNGKQMKCLIQQVKCMTVRMYRVLSEKILQYNENQSRTDCHCFACVKALILMASKLLIDSNVNVEDIKEYTHKDSSKTRRIDLGRLQWAPENTSLIERNLWALVAVREDGDDISDIINSKHLLYCLEGLERCNSPALGLMLWLLPEFTTAAELLTRVEEITGGNYAWLTRDKMLFWLACLRNANSSEGLLRTIEDRIVNLQLDTGAFATVEGKEAHGDLISSAIGLLVLVSCACQDGSNNRVIESVLKVVQWIVNQQSVKKYLNEMSPVEREGINLLVDSWVSYAFSQYIAFTECCSDLKGV